MHDQDISARLRDQVIAAHQEGLPLRIRGGGGKDFYGRTPRGTPLELGEHRGILSYAPSELVITARAGTPLEEVLGALEARGQMLSCEPPRFAPGGTLGGAVAAGLAGPRRPWGGAPRDLLLGVKLLDGRGQILSFGGQVMKNVAGYDLSRLMAGALGTLGVLLEVSLKVLPRPALEWTLTREASLDQALDRLARIQGQPLPLTGACHLDGQLRLRHAGGEAPARRLAAEWGAALTQEDAFWEDLRDHRLPFFAGSQPLWRLSVPPAWTGALPGAQLLDWGGAQRWLRTDAPAEQIRALATAAGGHATLFRHGDRDGPVFQPLPAPLEALHRRLKAVFDPAGILNPGRFQPGW